MLYIEQIKITKARPENYDKSNFRGLLCKLMDVKRTVVRESIHLKLFAIYGLPEQFSRI